MWNFKTYQAQKRFFKKAICALIIQAPSFLKLEYIKIIAENLRGDVASGSVNCYNYFVQELTISCTVEDTQ